METKEIINCGCHSPQHQMLITRDPENQLAFVEIHLTNGSFLDRLKYAIRYLLGKKSDTGAWEEVVLDQSHGKALRILAQTLDPQYPIYNYEGGRVFKGDEGEKRKTSDTIVREVMEDLNDRSIIGIEKYGVTLDREDLSLSDWLQHAYEESLDKSLYLKRALKSLNHDVQN